MERQGPRTSRPVIVPRPERVRRIGSSGFGWLDGRLHRDGWLEVLDPVSDAEGRVEFTYHAGTATGSVRLRSYVAGGLEF